jgi:hypothetical protein
MGFLPALPRQVVLCLGGIRRRDDLLANALLLLRHTGMRIGECVDLSLDCLRPIGTNQWATRADISCAYRF